MPPKNRMFWSTLSSSYSEKRCDMYPMRCFTPSGSVVTSIPPTCAVPEVGASNPHSMRIVVDLPAPLLPRKPKISPRATSNDTSSTARNGPKRRVRWRTSIAGAVDIDLLLPPDGAREARIGEPGARKGARAIELRLQHGDLDVEHV